MVKRVEREYALATHVRVSSAWTRASLGANGVPDARMTVLQQPVDLHRFPAAAREVRTDGPLRVCFVGSLDLRKGFVYLLQAARNLKGALQVELVGATGDRCCRTLLDRERLGLDVDVRPGDPRPALARADVFVLPTLEDGSPFAVAEAMATALPVVTTASTGAAEWVRHSQSGWIVEPGSSDALTTALEAARARRDMLPAMGHQARVDTERRVAGCTESVVEWLRSL
jgi:glycosyltransferase involved in cell wall biosynthesis